MHEQYFIYYVIFCYSFSLGCVVCEGAKGEQVGLLILSPLALPFLFIFKLFKLITSK